MTDIVELQHKIVNCNAEIERLQKEGLVLNKTFMGFVNKHKAEAIKEFAKRVHEEFRIYGIKDKFNKEVFLNVVDNVKKEMVGDNE